jgi:hypothetical protein
MPAPNLPSERLAPPFRGGWEGSGQYKGKLTLFNQTP